MAGSTQAANNERVSGGLREKGKIKSSADRPLVTVITVVYNRVGSVEETILSVLSLKHTNVEFLVVDGGSTDGTVDVLRKYSDQIDYWISEPDKGIYDAMNKGIAVANGEWINFMNCGDRFDSPDSLTFFQKDYTEDILYGDALIEYGSFNLPWKNIPLDEMWKRTPFCHQAAFVRASVMKTYKFDTTYRLSADFDFLYKAWLDGKRFLYINHLICYYDNRDGASKKYELRSFRERRSIVMKHPHSFRQRIYYIRTGLYLVMALTAKRILGERLTTWVTSILKR